MGSCHMSIYLMSTGDIFYKEIIFDKEGIWPAFKKGDEWPKQEKEAL